MCREVSVPKLDGFKGRITVVPGETNDREVVKRAVAGCDAVLVVLAPMGVQQYASGTAQAVLDYARRGARLVLEFPLGVCDTVLTQNSNALSHHASRCASVGVRLRRSERMAAIALEQNEAMLVGPVAVNRSRIAQSWTACRD